MGLKEWGQGQEDLVDFFYRYVKESPKNCQWMPTGAKIGEKINGNNRSPVEIDQIALLLDNHTSNTKLIHAIQCKESINGRDEAKKVLQSFNQVDTVKKLFNTAQRKHKFKRVVTYAYINDAAKKTLTGVELLSVQKMTSKINDYYKKYKAKGRKGYAQEPMGWIIRLLGTFTAENQNGKGKMNPQMLSDRANRAWVTMHSPSWLIEHKNTKKAKQILHKNPRLVEKLRAK